MILVPGQWTKYNVPSGLVALVAQSASVFFVLWLISDQLGLEELGLYSLLMGGLTILSLTEFGIGTTMVSFSQRGGAESKREFKYYYSTAWWTSTSVALFFILLAYWPLEVFLQTQMPRVDLVVLMQNCLPAVLLTAAAIAVGKVPINTLNGLNHFAPMQLLRTGVYILLPPLAYFGMSEMGLLGVVLARLVVEIVLTTASHFMVWLSLSGMHFFPRWFSKTELKEMLRLSLSFQTSSIILVLFEPLAKIALSLAGSLAIVGQYEVAARITGFTKELFIRPMAFLGGIFARTQENSSSELRSTLLRDLALVSMPLGALSFTAILATLLLTEDIMLDGATDFYTLAAICLGVGWATSVCAVGPYFYCVGLGNNRPNLESAIIISLGSALFSVVAIISNSIWLVPFGAGLSLVVGEIYLIRKIWKIVKFRLSVQQLSKAGLLVLIIISAGIAIYMLDKISLSGLAIFWRLILIGGFLGMISCAVLVIYQATFMRILRNKA